MLLFWMNSYGHQLWWLTEGAPDSEASVSHRATQIQCNQSGNRRQSIARRFVTGRLLRCQIVFFCAFHMQLFDLKHSNCDAKLLKQKKIGVFGVNHFSMITILVITLVFTIPIWRSLEIANPEVCPCEHRKNLEKILKNFEIQQTVARLLWTDPKPIWTLDFQLFFYFLTWNSKYAVI